MSDNLTLWREVEKTDPKHTKAFKGKGGFAGTAISPMWLIRQATERWGPIGGKWGIRVLSSEIVDGIGGDRLHVLLAEVYYPLGDGTQGTIPCFGQTQLCGHYKAGGAYLDEEAPKKSLTDALTKGLSWLGFAADVHMGLFDDVKYVNQVNQEFRQDEVNQDHRKAALAIMDVASKKGRDAMEVAWKALSPNHRKALNEQDRELLKVAASTADAKNGKAASNAQ